MGLRSQRGSALVVFVGWWAIAMLFVGIALDAGRIYMARERMRSALDAAALAGALQFEREVVVFVEVIQVIRNADLTKPPQDLPAPRRVRGNRKLKFEQQGYLADLQCHQSGYVQPSWSRVVINCPNAPCIESERPVDTGRVRQAAFAVLNHNNPRVQVDDFYVEPSSGTVTVLGGRTTVNMNFLRAFGFPALEIRANPPPVGRLVPPDPTKPEYCKNATFW